MSMPETIPIFTNKTGTDYVASSDPNVAYDEIENIANYMGALGKPQSWSATLLSCLRKHRRNMSVEVSGGVPVVRAGEAVLENTDGTKWVFRQNTADVTGATGNLDAGTIAIGTYYVYLYGGTITTTAPVVFSTDATACYAAAVGTAPYRKIGWFFNEVAGSMAVTFAGNFKEIGDETNYVYVSTLVSTNIESATSVTIPGYELRMVTNGRLIKISAYFSGLKGGDATTAGTTALVIDGTIKQHSYIPGDTDGSLPSMLWGEILPAGGHTIQLMWVRTGGSSGIIGTILYFDAIEL